MNLRLLALVNLLSAVSGLSVGSGLALNVFRHHAESPQSLIVIFFLFFLGFMHFTWFISRITTLHRQWKHEQGY